jgi:hypothetical protein
MTLKTTATLKRSQDHVDSPRLLRAARCTNASALAILPSSAHASSGMKPRNSASFATQISTQ